ncbi:Bifunctional protein FolC [compost metagenome]
MANARIRGRLQRVDRDGVEVLVDVGHNPQAARELAAALKAAPVAGRTVAVFAALQDKDAVGVVQALEGQVQAWHLAGLDGARAQSAAALQSRLHDTAAGAGHCHDSVAAALQAAVAEAAAGDRVLVFGSFHTAAQALQWLDAVD